MNEHDWFYRVYSQDTDAEVFGVFAPVVKLWQEKLSAGNLPDWTDFAVDDFIGWYGHISLGEMPSDFSEMIFRLWGTALTDLWGKDYTGKSMAEDALPRHWEEIEQPYMESLHRNKGIGYCGGTLYLMDRDFINTTYIDLPVTRNGQSPYTMSVYLRNVDRSAMDSAEPLYSYIEKYEPQGDWPGLKNE